MTGRRSHNRTRSDEKISDSIMERRMHILPNISHACKTKVRSPVMHCDNTYKLRGFSIPQAASLPPPPHAQSPPRPPLDSGSFACLPRPQRASTGFRIFPHTHARTHAQGSRRGTSRGAGGGTGSREAPDIYFEGTRACNSEGTFLRRKKRRLFWNWQNSSNRLEGRSLR